MNSVHGAGRLPGGAWQPTPVFLSGESHGQKNLVGYRPWGCKESDTTEQLSMHATQDVCSIQRSLILFKTYYLWFAPFSVFRKK